MVFNIPGPSCIWRCIPCCKTAQNLQNKPNQKKAPASKGPSPLVQTEIYRLYVDGPNDLAPLVKKYPLVVTVSIVVFGILGIVNVFNLSIIRIVSGAFMLTLSAGLAVSVYKNFKDYGTNIFFSLLEMKNALFLIKKKAPQPKKFHLI